MKFKKPKFWDYRRVSFLSVLLYPFSLIYLLSFFLIKIFENRKKFQIPTICIGNIYLGGTGKTPLAREVFNIIKSFQKNPAYIKKSYDYLHDEIKMLKKTGKVYTSKNRGESISLSMANNHDVAILDDGFQDFSIKPNFSILCFNSKQLIGNGFVLPSGPLRENFKSIERANCIVINGCKNLKFENKINESLGRDKKIFIFYSKYRIENIENFQNREITAFAGIGNPQNFFELLKDNNLQVKRSLSFPDHHKYSQNDFNEILKDKSNKLVTTEKDYFRMSDEHKKLCDYVEVSLEIQNKEKFKNLIKKYL